jgi:hypothetical protein
MMNQIKSATEWAEAVATRAGNYSRAVRNGSPHDLTEVRQLLENVETLAALIARDEREARRAARTAAPDAS